MQYCGVPGNMILDAVSTIRDVIAYAENTATPLCVLSLDFAQAFDRIAHQYLFCTLQAHGIDAWFIECIKPLYAQATTAIRLQGLSVGRIPIRSGIRQGCPLSMILFALCIQPLLNSMEGRLAGLAMGNSKKKIKVVAYADDITVFVTHPEEFNAIRQVIDKYERASGALLNPGKSKALAIENWPNPVPQLGIAFHSTVKILGISFAATTELSGKNSWDTIVNTVQTQAKHTYARNLCLAQRIVYIISNWLC
jgi:hypothetical protein